MSPANHCTQLVTMLLAILLAVVAAGCASSRPRIKVLGVTDAQAVSSKASKRALVVFLEVVNPGAQELKLSRLEYRLDAESVLAVRGEIPLSRAVAADSSTVIEVPVQIDRSRGELDRTIPYLLSGRLFTVADRVERSWKVNVRGVLDPDALAGMRSPPRVRMRMADSE